jgi:hypothetical protein
MRGVMQSFSITRRKKRSAEKTWSEESQPFVEKASTINASFPFENHVRIAIFISSSSVQFCAFTDKLYCISCFYSSCSHKSIVKLVKEGRWNCRGVGMVRSSGRSYGSQRAAAQARMRCTSHSRKTCIRISR